MLRAQNLALSAGGLMFAALCLYAPDVQAGFFDKLKEAITSESPGDTVEQSPISNADVASGLREALRVGSERVIEQVSVKDGFNADQNIHIPLPGTLANVQKLLNKVGMSYLTDDLELRLNRAAEAAAPQAKELFIQSISEMTLEDVQKIYNGPDDAATRYFQGKMTPELSERMTPVVEGALADVGAIKAYDTMMQEYKEIPFVPNVKNNLTQYAVEKSMDGIFYYLAKEEAAIRNNPVERTTELLKKVFGASQ